MCQAQSSQVRPAKRGGAAGYRIASPSTSFLPFCIAPRQTPRIQSIASSMDQKEHRAPMAEIQLHNTLSGKIEPFVPQRPGEVRMYTCGPTVYDYAHIGNYRTFVFQDLLRRFLRLRGYRLNHAMNLTDVDDRIISNAAAAGKSIRDYTEKFVQAFFDDCKTLSIEAPEHWIRATDHIPEMVQLIQRLRERTFTYPSEGSIYYRITKFPAYGKLSKIDLSGIQVGARVDNDRYEKESARDFALWKAPKPGEHFWETAIGSGRPGWHIECSAMAMKYLGETLDIHTGGVDLTFPHHENEIAQSEALTGKQFVRYWLHSEHLSVDGQKMSKSLGNFYTLRDLAGMGYAPETVRYLLASAPYRKKLNFTFDGLKASATAIERLRNFKLRLETEKFPEGVHSPLAERASAAAKSFDEALDDDLNTAEALAAAFEYIREANTAMDSGEFVEGDIAGALAFLARFDCIFDVLNPSQRAASLSDAEVEALIAERVSAKRARDFRRADEIRSQLAKQAIVLEDTKEGVRWKRQ